jgi:uncharacterized membrane protein YdjX (TVP38/TMEM64 family)
MVGLAQRQAYVGPIAEDGPMAQYLEAQSSSGARAIERPPVATSEALRARDFAAPALVLGLLVTGTAAAIVFRQHLMGLQGMGYLGVFLGNVVASSSLVVPVPGLAATMGAALLWNPFLVGLAGATGSAVADAAGYLIGVSSHKVVDGHLGHRRWYARIEAWMERRGFLTLFLFAAIPNPMFDVAGIVAGSMGYPFKRFAVACWLGKATKFVLLAMIASWSIPALGRIFGL